MIAAPVQRGAPCLPVGAPAHRQIDVEALALAFPALVGMAEEIGIFLHRVGVEVHHQHVAAGIEDLLRAVAVMIIDIEDRDPARAIVAQPLRGDRGVVDEAIAAGEAGAGMVARRPAQREGGALAGLDQPGGGERGVVRRLDRVPGALDEGRAAIEGIKAELRLDLLRHHVAAQSAHRPCIGHGGARAAGFPPFRPYGGQEVDIIGPVHLLRGRQAVLVRLAHRAEADRVDAVPDIIGARRHLEGRHDLGRHQFEVSGMARMAGREDGLHAVRLRCSAASLARCAGGGQAPG